MKNFIEELPEQINITVTKQDLIEFAEAIIRNYQQNQSPHNLKYNETGKSILNVSEASELIGLSKSTIYGKVCHGEIPHYKRGKRLYFKTEELEEWLTETKGYYRKDIERAASDYILRNPRKF